MSSTKRVLVTGGSGFIGTNLIETLGNRPDLELLNLDAREPKRRDHRAFWRKCDLLDAELTLRHVQDFQPAEVIHLASRTDMFGKTVDEYASNHVGTANIAAAIKRTHSIERVIFTSSQYVVGPGALPTDDFDFRPHTTYGESKVLSEKAVRAADLDCTWTIIRPTNVWGRWHPRYPSEFWKVVKDGRYVHPGGAPVIRCYGYVGNVIYQIQRMLEADPSVVAGKVYYVGDPPMDLLDWTNAFSLQLTGRKVRVVPRTAVAALGKVGDLVIAMGGNFPIFSSRYRSMTESYVTPMQRTFDDFGMPPISLEEGVRETGSWLQELGPYWQQPAQASGLAGRQRETY